MLNRYLSSVVLLLLLLAARLAQAAFTHPALWKLGFIDKTHAGTWCYRPGPSPAHAHRCANDTLSALLDVHITNNQGAGLSIAYYDLVDFSVLGGADWNKWDAVTLPVGVCMAGRVDGLEKTFSTTCRFAVTDNDHETPSSHAEECIVSRPQLRITDGCYTPPPRRPWFRLDESTSSVLTIISIVIALPLFGIYRWYRTRRTRQQVGLEDGQALPLGGLGECMSTGGARPDVSCVETSRAELPDLETRSSAPAM